MFSIQTRSAIALILALGAAAGAAFAEEGEAQDNAAAGGWLFAQASTGSTGGAAAATATESADQPATVPSLGGGAVSVPVLGGDSSVSATQRASSSAYDMAGAGIGSAGGAAGTLMTSPVKGRAIRFASGLYIYPEAMVGVGFNDNVRGSNTNEVSSSITVLRPGVVAEMKHRGDRYTLGYTGNYGWYQNSSADNFNHHDFWLGGDNYFTTRARLGWGAGYMFRSDARGSTDVSTAVNEPNRWEAPVARVLGIYGAPKALGRIEVEASWMQKRYKNNRAVTETFDLDTSTLAGRFFYRVMPKTSLVFEARNTWNDYVSSASLNDNTYAKLLAGMSWDVSAKTTGSVKLGRAYKRFSSDGRVDTSANSWEAQLVWTPLTYSAVRVQTAQDIVDSTGLGNFTNTRSLTAGWDHKWASYFTSSLSGTYVQAKYDGVNRDDDVVNLGLGVYRELGYNFRAGVSHNYTKRNSNLQQFDFTRNVTMFTLEFVL